MKITQVRNATLLIHYAGTRFLIDPMLAPKGSYPGFEGMANSHLRNPLVELPLPMATLLEVDAVIVTHDHLDHWDDVAKTKIPKHLPLFVQHQKDADTMRGCGFEDVRLLGEVGEFAGIRLQQTEGRHGSDTIMALLGDRLGEVSGVVFSHPAEKTLYLAGDTVWNAQVEQALHRHQPEVVVLNCGDAQVTGLGAIIMGKEDVAAVYQAAPQATLIASHMEAVNHALLSRRELRDYLDSQGMAARVRVPEDGDTMVL
ncbi:MULTISPECIES: MBL fold metallo-hydrolase [Aeromonas]|uniref:MBL fold metallo-hydrolase n=1 Tax=Aeromonas TaxID=642 RepID=UPI000F5DEDD7|nr:MULTISPECIES: MBL fold metallo-hydrolase [Aeromonas]MBP9662449.1 MBL fold metallo-hydrolase [Aeromonas sp.]MBL0510900.1 MBL fold metallo-hydrolase [Aeromonas caviae]MBP4058902.1 MBL fold metallo-hydrolase [Aeromonas sp. Prich7-2]MCR3983836.1 MBL fold metallo-hydrolase [Aeromonas caviae]MDH1993277.1 MBL fold metallo-hydrolase [Aeromonas caviae]